MIREWCAPFIQTRFRPVVDRCFDSFFFFFDIIFHVKGQRDANEANTSEIKFSAWLRGMLALATSHEKVQRTFFGNYREAWTNKVQSLWCFNFFFFISIGCFWFEKEKKLFHSLKWPTAGADNIIFSLPDKCYQFRIWIGSLCLFTFYAHQK